MEDGNNILTIHAEWLRDNGFLKESKECFKQAQQYPDLYRTSDKWKEKL